MGDEDDDDDDDDASFMKVRTKVAASVYMESENRKINKWIFSLPSLKSSS